MESYWKLTTDGKPTDETITFIKEQADMLSKETCGKVIAQFIPKRLGAYGASAALAQAAEVFGMVSHVGSGRKGKDASVLYDYTQYEFFITDSKSKYELALFDITCNDEFPIQLEIENSIASEAKTNVSHEINSLKEFQDYFSRILKTRKVRYVIKRLIEMADNNSSETE